ncbi:MAG: phosphoesterase [Planctomycetaceae bacterium]|nr:phosphoesterase [Planctomycetaceae bacterium]
MTMVQTEQVLVVPTELFHRLGYFQGFSSDTDRYLEELLSPTNTSYRPRSEMESDPGFKQLIPYVVFCHRDPQGQPSVFCYTRGTGQGEQRLHRKRSIGVGGHISSEDVAASDESHPYEEGLQRELNEEVLIETPYQSRCVGLINDDETDVGKVHLGVVHLFTVDQPEVRPRESEIVDAGFHPVAELNKNLAEFETWSSICLQAMFESNGQQDPLRQ